MKHRAGILASPAIFMCLMLIFILFVLLKGLELPHNFCDMYIFSNILIETILCLSESGVIDGETGSLSSMFVDYIDGARQYLEGENDRDLPILQEIRLHFSGFIQNLISNTPSESGLLLSFVIINVPFFYIKLQLHNSPEEINFFAYITIYRLQMGLKET